MKRGLMTILLLVESSAKAKTIGQYVGARYLVRATKGHLQDLPEDRLGVDVENGFELEYVVTDPQLVEKFRQSALRADELILATDPDREGEAIAWQAAELLKREIGSRPVRRVEFHELTQQAILDGLASRGRSTCAWSKPSRPAGRWIGW
ncbi:MAG: toprim domain-containing protein [Ignavibacteriales bacterium]|nr:toprim domain-containing protein [Ignavibacteriales bacterium]